MVRTLYLGLEPSREPSFEGVHFPIITIEPLPLESPGIQAALAEWPHYTLLIFTSKIAVHLWQQYLKASRHSIQELASDTLTVAVGRVTASHLEELGFPNLIVAEQETAEGVIARLQTLSLRNPYILWPHSALSRPILNQFFESQGWRYRECVLYHTVPSQSIPLPDPSAFDQIVFTSPSTVDAWMARYGALPTTVKLIAIGPITQARLYHWIYSLKVSSPLAVANTASFDL